MVICFLPPPYNEPKDKFAGQTDCGGWHAEKIVRKAYDLGGIDFYDGLAVVSDL